MSDNFGASLREARERKGISLRQIAEATKISVAALDNLERNDFSKLPGGIFSRAFVRSYAIEVGLDPDQTVHEYLEHFSGDAPPAAPQAPVPAAAAPASHPWSPIPPRHAPLAEVTDEFDFESKQRMAAVVLKLVLVSVPIAAVIMYFSSRGAAPASQRETPAPAPHAIVVRASPDAEAAASRVTPAAAPPKAAAPPTTPLAVPSGLTIEIAPSADCWAKLTVDGKVVVSRVLKAGEHETRQFRDAAVLRVGDAAACAISINGRPARPLGGAKQVREVRITRDNYAALLQ